MGERRYENIKILLFSESTLSLGYHELSLKAISCFMNLKRHYLLRMKFTPVHNPPNLFLTGSKIEAKTLPSPNPPRVRDHSVALGEEVLPVDKQPQQQRVQRLPDRR